MFAFPPQKLLILETVKGVQNTSLLLSANLESGMTISFMRLYN